MKFKLTEEQNYKIKKMIASNVQFIAGTTAPAESDKATLDIESLNNAISYYKTKYDELVAENAECEAKCYHMIAEPKYMGSRCTLYLNKDQTKCFATSRNGGVIKKDMSQVYQDNMWILETLNTDFAIVDGELLPWAFLGKGLIEKEFKALPVCINAEHSFLKSTQFESLFNQLMSSDDYSKYQADKLILSRKELAEKYPAYSTYSTLDQIEFDMNLTLDEDRIVKYSHQVELYGKDSDPVFKPFNVLKSTKDGVDTVYVWENQAEIYSMLTKHSSDIEKGCVFDIRSDADVQKLKDYFDQLTALGFEGIVIKPVYNFEKLLPYMKVRNKEYLRIIYGYDYDSPKKLAYFVNKKRCNKKRKLSAVEWQLGNELLITTDNARKKEIMAQILFEIELEKEVDCRL